ncbi:MAG TPA: hypothetical protein VM124_01125 [Candidatus Limnocylindrales bacterium]|nr:hypothetical protein [Candidatus Limnocylindrales bacterium]
MTYESVMFERIAGNPPELDKSDLMSLAGLYARVFAGEPWNEFTVCPLESKFFGKDMQPGQSCSTRGCEATLALAYPRDKTIEYITNELSRPQATLFLLRDKDETDNRIVGFSWGFAYSSPDEFAEQKYQTDEMQTAISELLRDMQLGANGLWYLSESGIEDDSRYRGQGWSRTFHTARLAVAETLGLDAIQRTNCYGNMYRTSTKTMSQIMGPEAEPELLTRQLRLTGKIINDLLDTENSERVLFAKRQGES